jgi:hypothetical protein
MVDKKRWKHLEKMLPSEDCLGKSSEEIIS